MIEITLIAILIFSAKSEVVRKSRSVDPIDSIFSDTSDNTASGTVVKSDYENEAIKSEINNDYERLKSLMHYDMSKKEAEALSGYTGTYHNMDDEDLRTNSATMYSWPHPYNPYDHIFNVHHDTSAVKPVHEYVDEHMPNYNSNSDPDKGLHTPPLVGENPFISSMVHDYTDRDTSGDSLTFTNLDFWLPPTTGGYYDEDSKRDKRLGVYSPPVHYDGHGYHKGDAIETVTKKSYDKGNSFDKHEKGNQDKEIHKGEYEDEGKKYNEYRDIADSFGKQYSSGDQNKNSKYLLKKNAHQGENKKGFHRVYHKDEYQEDKEFFNNNENKIHAEENGGATGNFGHSTGLLRSQAAAAIGNKGNAYKKSGAVDRGKFENSHNGHDSFKGYDNDYNGYIHSPDLSSHSYNSYSDYPL